MLGGTQSLHTNSLDETYALPTEHAVTVALRTQQIIAHESGADRVIDPLAGSYYVEWLTDEMEKRALELIAKIDEHGRHAQGGGERLPAARDRRERLPLAARGGERASGWWWASTPSRSAEGPPIPTLKVDEEVQVAQIERLRQVKAARDARAVAAALAGVERAAREGRNVMPPIIAAVKAYATLGEISDVLPQGLRRLPRRRPVLGRAAAAWPTGPTATTAATSTSPRRPTC